MSRNAHKACYSYVGLHILTDNNGQTSYLVHKINSASKRDPEAAISSTAVSIAHEKR